MGGVRGLVGAGSSRGGRRGQPWTREQALTYLEVSAGSLCDPDVTATFPRPEEWELLDEELTLT